MKEYDIAPRNWASWRDHKEATSAARLFLREAEAVLQRTPAVARVVPAEVPAPPLHMLKVGRETRSLTDAIVLGRHASSHQ